MNATRAAVQELPPSARSRATASGQVGSKETPVVAAILKALALKGIWAWRANSGTQVIKASSRARRRVIKGAPAGTPDILLVLPVQARVLSLGAAGMKLESSVWGALCGLEVKSETGSQRLSQKAWQATAERHGVRYALVRSVREALAALEAWANA